MILPPLVFPDGGFSPVAADEHLIGPAESILDAAVGDVHSVDVLKTVLEIEND